MTFPTGVSAGTRTDREGRYPAVEDLPKLVPLPKTVLRLPRQVQGPEYVFILRPA